MLNMQEWLDSFNSATNGTITKNENSITLTATANDAYIAPTYRKSVEPNKTYTLSWKSNDSSTDGLVYVFIDDKQTSGYMFNANDKNTKSLNFTTPSDATYMSFRVGVSTTGNSKTYFDIQLEEGDTATPYEPYQEYTNDTIVTREENHTLYAMWEPLYTVTFDPDGGTLSETTKEVSYHEPYGELPTPTREGYTFMGWHGKNMFKLKEIADYKYSTTQYTVDIDNNSVMIGNDGGYEIIEYYLPELKANTKYTITGNTVLTNINGGTVRITTIRNTTNITNEQFLLSRFDADGVFSYVFTVGNQDETTAAILLYGNRNSTPTLGAKVNYSNIMITEGDTATEYEPYYITPTTPVVQGNDHTLKAIWQPNS